MRLVFCCRAVGQRIFLQSAAALVRDRREQQLDDFGQELHAMLRHFRSKHVTALVIPATRLASGAKRILIESGAVLPGPTRVALFNICTDSTSRAVELVRQANSSLVG